MASSNSKDSLMIAVVQDAWDKWEAICGNLAPNEVMEHADQFELIFSQVKQDRLSSIVSRGYQPCSILRLPKEIIFKILYDALDTFDASKWNFRALTEMAAVAKPFAAILRSHFFWPTLCVNDPPELIKAVLARNPTGLLSIHAEPFYDSRRAVEAQIATFLELATPHRRRWQSFTYSAGDLYRAVWDSLAGPTYSLTCIDLAFYGDGGINIEVLGPGPSFDHVRLSDVGIPWDSSRLRGVRTLQLAYEWELEEKRAPTPKELVDILAEMPRLYDLILSFTFDPSPPFETPSVRRVHLPELVSFKMKDKSSYGEFIVPRLSSDACRTYIQEGDAFPSSIFDEVAGSHFLHTLKTVVQELCGLHLVYCYMQTYSSITLIGYSRTQPPSRLSKSTPSWELPPESSKGPFKTLEFPVVSGVVPAAWNQLCRFLRSALDPSAYVRLSVQIQTWGSGGERTFPGLDLVGIINELEINSIHLPGGSSSLAFLEPYFTTPESNNPSQLQEFINRIQRLRCLGFGPSLNYDDGFTTKICLLIRMVLEAQDSDQLDNPRSRGVLIWCSKSMIDVIAESLPAGWIKSGLVEWKESPSSSYGWGDFEAEWNQVTAGVASSVMTPVPRTKQVF